MSSSTVRLPDGQTFTVQPVFAGLFFKSDDLNRHHPSPFPIGWTIVIHTRDDETSNGRNDPDAMAVDQERPSSASAAGAAASPSSERHTSHESHVHSFSKPTLQKDSLYISSISNPPASEFKEPASPTRQLAMMLWISLYWYFHQPAPSKTLPTTDNSRGTPADGRPRGDWRISIERDGVLRGRNLLPKLERMGLIASLDSAVCWSFDDLDKEWDNMFVSQQMFWQTPSRLFLFTLQPTSKHAMSPPGSPVSSSRPSTPVRHRETSPRYQQAKSPVYQLAADVPGASPPQNLLASPSFPVGPYFSSSHLPTYYPPAALQYTFSNNTRHPVRPKPPRMGEVFYTRFVPSVGKYLSFRVASSSSQPVPYLGPVSQSSAEASSDSHVHLTTLCDMVLMQMWMSKPRVAKFWGGYQANFLANALASKHSFPVIAMWDGIPFGYFEIYWVKEDILGRYINNAQDWDRGIHVFIGEEWARGQVSAWLSSLAHWIFGADYRTTSVCIEPRVDNIRFIQHLQSGGFVGEQEVSFPHKQSWFGRLRRENWLGPSL
ncbi:acyl-CoA N-acyltransferase [Coniella lustricola]|uniref:Acyl-CoA N-acyltransferase n=1 Tax=Coniella lustricola TaxID=2025994 RepID=A0A2T2ZVN9_9PEZI|nr:acyl-CoA N-acyltransferase [Coniella lustricola]